MDAVQPGLLCLATARLVLKAALAMQVASMAKQAERGPRGWADVRCRGVENGLPEPHPQLGAQQR